MMFHPYYGSSAGFGVLGAIMMFAFWVGIGLCILWTIRGSRHMHHYRHDAQPSADKPKALEIIQERFAKGEITSEQYAEMKKVLEK